MERGDGTKIRKEMMSSAGMYNAQIHMFTAF